jgi:hypothetical protein
MKGANQVANKEAEERWNAQDSYARLWGKKWSVRNQTPWQRTKMEMALLYSRILLLPSQHENIIRCKIENDEVIPRSVSNGGHPIGRFLCRVKQCMPGFCHGLYYGTDTAEVAVFLQSSSSNTVSCITTSLLCLILLQHYNDVIRLVAGGHIYYQRYHAQ